jgi:hypothetical protein
MRTSPPRILSKRGQCQDAPRWSKPYSGRGAKATEASTPPGLFIFHLNPGCASRPRYPLKALRERGTSPKDLHRKVIPIPSRFPIGNMAVRQDEECRGTPSVVLVARVGIGIGIAIGIENEVEPEVRTLGRSGLLVAGSAQLAPCDCGAEKGLSGKVKEPQRGVSSQPGASPREHRATMKMSPERAA